MKRIPSKWRKGELKGFFAESRSFFVFFWSEKAMKKLVQDPG